MSNQEDIYAALARRIAQLRNESAWTQRELSRRSGVSAEQICDLLTRNRDLIHVKRHLGSSDLSHLFAQAFVSAELLQMNPAFRQLAHAQVLESAEGRVGFEFFDTAAIVPHDFTIVYAVIADWRGRTLGQALPFFSKINLRDVTNELRSRDFGVEFHRVDVR